MKILEYQLDQDYLYCEQIIKQYSKSFYYAFSKLPKEKANAVFAIYAFCRLADNCVDSSGTRKEKLQALNTLEYELSLFEEGREMNHPLWRALRNVFQRYNMQIEPFHNQLFGQRMDLNFKTPKTLADLEEYSFYVAGSVGLMLLPILASQHTSVLEKPAISLGVAMQLTNILRDIGEDYHNNHRIYLPLEEMQNVSYTEKELENATINAAFVEIWEKLAIRAEYLYTNFENNIQYFDKDCRLPSFTISASLPRHP